jgi:hypothetical protein
MKAAIVPAVDEKWEVKEVPNLEPGPNQVLITQSLQVRRAGTLFVLYFQWITALEVKIMEFTRLGRELPDLRISRAGRRPRPGQG